MKWKKKTAEETLNAVKKEKVQQAKPKSILPGAMMVAFLASIVVYMVMIHVEKNALSDYAKGPVYLAAKEIPKGEILTEETIQEYVKTIEVDVKLIPQTALLTLDQITGLLPKNAIDAGTFLTSNMFENKNEIIASMNHPVIAGLKAEDLYQVVGGTLRSGDRIHIYTVNEETEETILVWENVFVQQVFDASGLTIPAEDRETAAQRVNILLEQENIEQFYQELAIGSLRVVKVIAK